MLFLLCVTIIVDKKHLFPDCLLWNRAQIDQNSQVYNESRQNTWTAEKDCTFSCTKDQNCVGVEYHEKYPIFCYSLSTNDVPLIKGNNVVYVKECMGVNFDKVWDY